MEVDFDEALVAHGEQAVAFQILRDEIVNLVLERFSPSSRIWVSNLYSSMGGLLCFDF
jgi:hypothetical protein